MTSSGLGACAPGEGACSPFVGFGRGASLLEVAVTAGCMTNRPCGARGGPEGRLPHLASPGWARVAFVEMTRQPSTSRAWLVPMAMLAAIAVVAFGALYTVDHYVTGGPATAGS